MILGRDILMASVLNLKSSDNVIKSYDEIFKCSTAPMVDLSTYKFKDLETEKISPEVLFMNSYTE